MSADILPALPMAASPPIRGRMAHGDILSGFEIAPTAMNNNNNNNNRSMGSSIHSHTLHGNSYRPFVKMNPPIPIAEKYPAENSPEMAKSWEDVPTECDKNGDALLNSLSDWSIVSKPLSLSVSQFAEEDIHASSLHQEGILVSEPMETVNESTYATNPPYSTALVEYKPNPIVGFLKSTQQQPSWKGLYNLGNTCYLNASLQTLLSLDGFVDDLIASSSVPSSQTKLVEELARVFMRLRGKVIPDKDDEWTMAESDAVDPTRFKASVDDRSPLFVGYDQHDAHEFITTLLDLLHDELKHPEINEVVDPVAHNSHVIVAPSHDYVVVNESTLNMASSLSSMDCTFENSAKKARFNSRSEPIGLSASMDGDVSDETKDDGHIQQSTSLSSLSMEGIEELLTNPKLPIYIPSHHRGSLDGPERNRSWRGFWKTKPRAGYLVGGRSSAPSLTSSNRYSGYKSMDQSWQVIGNELLQDRPSLAQENIPPVTEIPLNSRNGLSASSVEIGEQKKCSSGSLVDSYFTTEVRNHLTCDSCKFTRSQIETFRCLSLELVDSGSSEKTFSGFQYNQTIQESLRKFLSPEKREIKCEKCFFDTATRTTEITKLPRALLLHLKRFIVDVSPDYMSITCKKNHTAVEFSKHLSLSPFNCDGVLAEYLANDVIIPEDNSRKMNHDQGHTKGSDEIYDETMHQPEYSLRSIIHHLGSSAESGHYTATLNRCNQQGHDISRDSSRSWLNCNDNLVSGMTEMAVFSASSQATAYLFLYELQG